MLLWWDRDQVNGQSLSMTLDYATFFFYLCQFDFLALWYEFLFPSPMSMFKCILESWFDHVGKPHFFSLYFFTFRQTVYTNQLPVVPRTAACICPFHLMQHLASRLSLPASPSTLPLVQNKHTSCHALCSRSMCVCVPHLKKTNRPFEIKLMTVFALLPWKYLTNRLIMKLHCLHTSGTTKQHHERLTFVLCVWESARFPAVFLPLVACQPQDDGDDDDDVTGREREREGWEETEQENDK